jgi:tetratricopeptide (TPR) repeat protein
MAKRTYHTKKQSDVPGTPWKTAKQWVEEGNAYCAEKRYNGKGLLLHHLKRHNEALAAYEKALQLDPNEEIYWCNKGILLEDTQRYEEALAAFEQAIQHNPHSVSAWAGKAEVLMHLEKFEEAEEASNRAAELRQEGYEDEDDDVDDHIALLRWSWERLEEDE